MNRRHLLKLISMGVIGHTLDIDKLLWVPGQKKIFLPTPGVNLRYVLDIELQRIIPKVRMLYERDDFFWKTLSEKEVMGKRLVEFYKEEQK